MPPASEPQSDPSEDAGRPIGLSTALDRRNAWAQLFGDAPDPAPVHVAHFRIVRRLGAGGMGVVYEAQDERLGRRVAVKLLRGGSGAADANALRLMREARAMALVAHPNVVTIHEVGEQAGRMFIAMELVVGCTLREWAAETHSLAEVLDVFTQAAAGLAAAHAAGLVHRDFKPENVLVGEEGQGGPANRRVRVLDFGLARTREREDALLADQQLGRRDPESLDVRVTATGAIAGTPAYMAPEQWRGEEPDHRADQFAWAVALWEVLYGQRPHAGSTVADLARAVVEGPIPIAPASDRVPSWLVAILQRALAVDPQARYAGMDELLHALARREDPAADRAQRARRRRRVLGATAIGALALSIAAAIAITSGPPPDACAEGMSYIPGGDGLDPFCLDRAEVTVAQWMACVEAGGCAATERTAFNGLNHDNAAQAAFLAQVSTLCTRPDQPDHPVNCVTHSEAAGMCAWRGARLPTDDEWQWAAHGADQRTPYPWGTSPPDHTVCLGDYWRTPLPSTCPVAPEKVHDRSPQSVVGLIGNVWEWTSTPSGPEDQDARIFRGGGFRNQYTGRWPEAADGSPRSFWGEATFKDPELGFRCAAPLAAAP